MLRSTRRDSTCSVKLPKLIYWFPKLWMATATSERFLMTIGKHLSTESQKLQWAYFAQMQWSWFNTKWGKSIHTKALWLRLHRKNWKPETDEETEQHSTNCYLSYESSDSIDSNDTSTKTISADNEAVTQMMGLSTGHAAEHLAKKPQTTSMPSKTLT